MRSSTPQGRVALALIAPHVLPSVLRDAVGTLISRFRSSQLRDTQPTHAPVQRFKCALTVRPHMARGQDGSLLLSCMTLSFTTSRRFIPTLSTHECVRHTPLDNHPRRLPDLHATLAGRQHLARIQPTGRIEEILEAADHLQAVVRKLLGDQLHL